MGSIALREQAKRSTKIDEEREYEVLHPTRDKPNARCGVAADAVSTGRAING